MRRLLLPMVVITLFAASCSDDSPDSAGETTTTVDDATTTTEAPEPFRILVTNDDGIGAPGIDLLVAAVAELPDVEVTVVAPDSNKSGSSDTTSDAPVTATDSATASGYPGTAIDGFPADTVLWAIQDGNIEETPDLVISGINEGQNLGPIIELSGTVGAARTASRLGVPALALSQGLADEPDFEAGVAIAVQWLDENLPTIRDSTVDEQGLAVVWNINIPTCATGEVREIIDVPPATNSDVSTDAPACDSTETDPSDDINAFVIGFAPKSDVRAA